VRQCQFKIKLLIEHAKPTGSFELPVGELNCEALGPELALTGGAGRL
jgi:hypothetical protein